MTDSFESRDESTQVQAKVRFVATRQMPSLTAHHMMVQQDESDIVVSFFETLLPVIPPDTEGRQNAIAVIEADGIQAECIAKIRIGKHRLPAFVQILSEANDRIKTEMKLLGEKYGIDESNNSEN